MTENEVPLKRRTPAARLAIAWGLIQSVLDEQDTAYRVCGECGLKHYGDIQGRKVANKLTGVLTTLDNVMKGLS